MLRRSLLAILFALSLTACGDHDGSFAAASTPVAQQLAVTGIGQFLGITWAAMTRNGEWEEYTYDAADQQAICLGGTNYQVNLRRGDTNKVLLYLEGGGACWDLQTCWQTPLAKQTAGSAQGVGILEPDNPANPFAGWNVVYASYCDGSVYSGNNVVDYDGHHTYHHGIQNLSAAVTLMQQQFPHPEVVVVSGSSAGGYGTFTGYGIVRIAYPTTPLLVLNDSGPGLQNPADTTGVGDRLANWHYTQFLPADCANCTTQPAYLADWALDRDPNLRVALFSYLRDGIIRMFLKLDGPSYQALLQSVSGDLHSRHPDRFKRFFKSGASHTVLELPEFYTLSVAGTTVRDWTAAFVTNGGGWQDLIDQ